MLDDGSGGKWLEPEGRELKIDDEASYLDKAIGECEGELLEKAPHAARDLADSSFNLVAAFRNANGLLWARISYVNHTIRVRPPSP